MDLLFAMKGVCCLYSVTGIIRGLEEQLFIATKEKENLEDEMQIKDKKVWNCTYFYQPFLNGILYVILDLEINTICDWLKPMVSPIRSCIRCTRK